MNCQDNALQGWSGPDYDGTSAIIAGSAEGCGVAPAVMTHADPFIVGIIMISAVGCFCNVLRFQRPRKVFLSGDSVRRRDPW